MSELEDFKLYLPKYLTPSSSKQLFDNLKDFPNNINKQFYTNGLLEDKIVYQGDGINNLLYADLPSQEIKALKSVVLNNTCDNDVNNKRYLSSYINYSPLINLEKYEQTLLKTYPDKKNEISNHIKAIRNQEITQIFYLPKGAGLDGEYIICFDRISSCKNESISRESLKEQRIFSLSNYGFYLFLFKLSIHFTRFGEAVDRG